MSWTATRLTGQRNTGTRIFLEPERREYRGPKLQHLFVPQTAIIDGAIRNLVKAERFDGNFVLTYRTAHLGTACRTCTGSP